jgi:hypothetical protein
LKGFAMKCSILLLVLVGSVALTACERQATPVVVPVAVPGPAGATGMTGASASAGATGATGSAGSAGAEGAKGEVGAPGDEGAKGDTGASGKSGSTIVVVPK